MGGWLVWRVIRSLQGFISSSKLCVLSQRLLKIWCEVCLSVSTGLKNILRGTQASNLHGNSHTGCVLGDIFPESWSCLMKKKKQNSNFFHYFLIKRRLIVEEYEVGSAFCQRVILWFLLQAVIPLEFRQSP